MRICFRNVYSKVCRILHAVIAITGQSHEIGTASLALGHIADRLLEQIFLGQHPDHQDIILDQADGSVFQLTGGIGFGMDVADLLGLEASLQTDRIVKAAANKEDIPGV